MTTTEAPLISVCIATHNRALLLPRAIRSVLGQTYRNLECIVVDDASTDNTSEIVKSFARDERLIYIRHEENRHVSATRNTGIDHANGKFVAFLDDDDIWLPSKLETQVHLILRLPEKVGLVYCWMDRYDNKENLLREHHPMYRGYVFPHVLDQQRLGGCPTLLVRRTVVQGVRFDESLRRGDDADFIRRVCRQYEVDFVPEPLVKVYENHGHERLSEDTRKGDEATVHEHLAIIDKFQHDLRLYPKQAAHIYAILANFSSRIGAWRQCFCYFGKALLTYPLARNIYAQMRNCIKCTVIRNLHALSRL